MGSTGTAAGAWCDASPGPAERLAVLAVVPQRPVDDPADLLLQLVHRPAVFRQGHPAGVDGLADRLVDLSGAEEVGHPLGRRLVVLAALAGGCVAGEYGHGVLR